MRYQPLTPESKGSVLMEKNKKALAFICDSENSTKTITQKVRLMLAYFIRGLYYRIYCVIGSGIPLNRMKE